MFTADGKASARILLVDDDRAFRLSTAELLREDGHEVVEAENGAQAAEALQVGLFDLMLLDLRMPGLDGLRMVEVLRERGEPIPILMISGFGTVESAVESLHLGADDFLTKPVDPDVLSARVGQILERRPLRASLSSPVEGMVGRSPAMRRVFDAVRRVAPTEATVLVTGETGTGKELVARAVHRLSERSGHPFIPVNCASLAEGVLESELFGHVRGAFTGAVRDKTRSVTWACSSSSGCCASSRNGK
jgi:two-component system response regulator HydG